MAATFALTCVKIPVNPLNTPFAETIMLVAAPREAVNAVPKPTTATFAGSILETKSTIFVPIFVKESPKSPRTSSLSVDATPAMELFHVNDFISSVNVSTSSLMLPRPNRFLFVKSFESAKNPLTESIIFVIFV